MVLYYYSVVNNKDFLPVCSELLNFNDTKNELKA